MSNPFKSFKKKEWALWIVSLVLVIMSNLLSGNVDVLTLSAACVGVTSLVFAAIGNVWAPILMIAFSIFYGIISWKFRYWGEVITYLGMTMPMAIWSTITWIKNPAKNGKEVAIQKLTKKAFSVGCPLHRDCYGGVLCNFGKTQHAKYCIQHHINHNKFYCGGTDYASLVILRRRLCGK